MDELTRLIHLFRYVPFKNELKDVGGNFLLGDNRTNLIHNHNKIASWSFSLFSIASVEKVNDSRTASNALAVSREVRQGIPFSTVSRRILKPSRSGCFPFVNVLMTICASPLRITSRRSLSVLPIFSTTFTGIPASLRAFAVPGVAIN